MSEPIYTVKVALLVYRGTTADDFDFTEPVAVFRTKELAEQAIAQIKAAKIQKRIAATGEAEEEARKTVEYYNALKVLRYELITSQAAVDNFVANSGDL